MSKIISIHSFRRGVGKSQLTANVATLLAAEGRRVGVVDTDLLAPSQHILFGLDDNEMSYCLNDYLSGKCPIQQTVQDVTPRLGPGIKGRVFLVPSSTKVSEFMHILHQEYDVDLFNDGLQTLAKEFELDALIIDTYTGLTEITLPTIAISNTLAIVLRLDKQDYQGTSVTVEIARRFNVPRILLVANQVSSTFDAATVKVQIEQTYGCEVAALLPFSDEMLTLDSRGIFVLHYPNHPATAGLKQLTAKLMT